MKFLDKLSCFLLLAALCGIYWLSAQTTLPEIALQKLDGSSCLLSAARGSQVLLIDFWATWCKPCEKLLNKLEKIQQLFGKQVVVAAISIDDAAAQSQVQSYVDSRSFSFLILLDPDREAARLFNPALKLPFTLIVDRSGRVVYSHTGYVPGYEKYLEEEIRKLIAAE